MDIRTGSCLMLLAWLWTAWSAGRTREVVHGTTLVTVTPWAAAAIGLWVLFSALGISHPHAAWRTHLAYFACVVSLTPAIGVLGARRPTCRAWPAFVLLPMVVVLAWPLASLGWSALVLRTLELETPQVVIFALVTVMGFGNYVGTRLTGSACLAAAALVLIPLGHSRLQGWTDDQKLMTETASVIGLAMASLRALRILRQRSSARSRFDRVWEDFVVRFGMVWSRRLLDRLQVLARKESWTCEVTPLGFVWPDQSDAATEAAVEHALRWLLRRFVDPAWLDERLGATNSAVAESMTIDL
ncbi:MAG: hypothetical protein SFV23_23025 [Planctomycetaceae bacterium]|nr:hypothetical protein [Planctomycetaceae bacterium]